MRRSRKTRSIATEPLKFCWAAGLLVLTTYCAGHAVTSTHAVYTASHTSQFASTTAFVFPKTVNDAADNASQRAKEAGRFRDAAISAFAQLKHEGTTSEEAGRLVQIILEAADKCRQSTISISPYVAELQSYAARSNSDVQRQITAAERVDAYVEPAYRLALSVSAEANGYVADVLNSVTQARSILEDIQAAEKKAKKEAEDDRQSGESQQSDQPQQPHESQQSDQPQQPDATPQADEPPPHQD